MPLCRSQATKTIPCFVKLAQSYNQNISVAGASDSCTCQWNLLEAATMSSANSEMKFELDYARPVESAGLMWLTDCRPVFTIDGPVMQGEDSNQSTPSSYSFNEIDVTSVQHYCWCGLGIYTETVKDNFTPLRIYPWPQVSSFFTSLANSHFKNHVHLRLKIRNTIVSKCTCLNPYIIANCPLAYCQTN